MLKISAASASGSAVPSGRHPRAPEAQRVPAEVAASRALIVAAPVGNPAIKPVPRVARSAAFLAHLIATAEKMPQTRVLRRLGSAEAATAYAAAEAGPGIRPRRPFSTSI